MKKQTISRVCTITIVALSIIIPNVVDSHAAPKKAALNKKRVTLTVGQSAKLKVKNCRKKVKWSSNKKKIVSVNKNGKIRGRKKGTAKITAKFGKKKLVCSVTVKAKKVTTNPDTDKPTDNKPSVPSPTSPSTTPAPATNPTTPPKSLLDAPTANPSTKDDGWVPGWY